MNSRVSLTERRVSTRYATSDSTNIQRRIPLRGGVRFIDADGSATLDLLTLKNVPEKSTAATQYLTLDGEIVKYRSISDLAIGTHNHGTGTTNYITRFTNGTTGEIGNSALINTATGIGLGIAIPTTLMHIYESSASTTPQLLLSNGGTGDVAIQFLADSQNYVAGIDNSTTNRFKICATAVLGAENHFAMGSTGTIGINTTPAVDIRMAIVDAKVNTVTGIGQQILFTNQSTIAGAWDGYAQYFEMNSTGNAANSAMSYAVQGVAYNYMTANNGGVVAYYAGYGNQLNTSGTLAYATGVRLQGRCRSGTVGRLCDIEALAPLTGGTISDEWFIYSLHDARSRLVGAIEIDSDTNGLVLGDGQDSRVLYDGTNTVFRTLVGSATYIYDVYTTVDTDCTVKIFGGAAKDAILDFVVDEQNHAADTFRMRTVYNATSASNLWKMQCDNAVKGTMVDLVTVTTAGNISFPVNNVTMTFGTINPVTLQHSQDYTSLKLLGKLGIGALSIWDLAVTLDQNTPTIAFVSNANNHADAYAGLVAQGYDGNQASIRAVPTAAGGYIGDKMQVLSYANSGMVIEQSGNFPVDIYNNGAKSVTVTGAGHVGINCTPNISAGATRALSISGGVGATSAAYLDLQGRRTTGTGDVGTIMGYNQSVNIGQISFVRSTADDAGAVTIYTKAASATIGLTARFGGGGGTNESADILQLNCPTNKLAILDLLAGSASGANTYVVKCRLGDSSTFIYLPAYADYNPDE